MNSVKKAKIFQDLIVWQKAHQFTLRIYQITQKFPKEEMYGLTSQLRRAAVSIPANIAESFRKTKIPEKCRFLNFSLGSLEEFRYYLILTQDLGYSNNLKLYEISKMLISYRNKIKNSES